MATAEVIINQILMSLVFNGFGWLGRRFVEKVTGEKLSPQEVESFFQSGLDQLKAKDLLQGLVNDLVKSVESRFKESGLGDSELEPVESYLKTLLTRLDVTPELAEKYRYDPMALSRYAEIVARPEEMSTFSESQQLLIREVLRNLGVPLLRLSFDLPDSLSLLHRRALELQQYVNEIRIDIVRTREVVETINPNRYLAEFEESYRTRLAESHDEMELLGLDRVRRNLRRYPLEAAFVHLRLDSDNMRVSLEKALEQHKKLLLKGTAGSGKTTLLRWLAIMIARGKLGKHSKLTNKLPIIVTLRNYNRQELPSTRSELLGRQLFAPPVSHQHLDGVLHERLKKGQALVLIDGVDEVTEDKLGAVRQWVKDLVSEYPRASYVISSRPVVNLSDWLGLKDGRLGRERFVDATVERMNDGELEDLVFRWHDAAAKASEDASIKAVALQLFQKICSDSGLRELASTPLLASAICALNLNSAGGLPVERSELYNNLVQMMVQKRDQERGIDDIMHLNLEQKLLLLGSIAARIVEDEDVGISKEELMAVIKNRLAMSERRTNSDKVFLFLLERTGLLRQVDQDSFEFIHKTFQEFLGARHFVQEHRYDYAGRYLMTRHGGEIAYFMAVLAPDAGPIIKVMFQELLQDKRNPYIDQKEALHYAARCVEDSVMINLQNGEEIVTLYQRLVKEWDQQLKGREQASIENKLSTKLSL